MELYEDQQKIKDELVPYIMMHCGKTLSHPVQKMAQIIGYAGTGKTTTTSKIVEEIAQYNKRVKLTAPTHKAVQVIKNSTHSEAISEYSTIHSHLKLKVKTDYNTGKQSLFPEFGHGKDDNYFDLLIVDESSMVGEELFNHIKNALDQNKVGFVLFTGDACQLPPVNEDFTIETAIPPDQTFKLEKVRRQAEESAIIRMSEVCTKYIRSKQCPSLNDLLSEMLEVARDSPEVELVNDYYKFIEQFVNETCDDSIALSYTNKNVDMINILTRSERRAEALAKENLPYIQDDILIMQERFQCNENIFQNNEEIIVDRAELINEQFKFWRIYPKDVPGYIDIIHDDSKEDYNHKMNMLATHAKMEQDREKRTKYWKGFYALKEKFAEVKYHYASTIHKSQGSSHSKAYLDYKNLDWVDAEMRTRLIYVAISRAREKIILYV